MIMKSEYRVHITRIAYGHMTAIKNYIANELMVPNAAKQLLLSMRESISKLDSMPERYKLLDEEPWRSKGIRRIIVENYYIYYVINENIKEVQVIAVIYAGRNQKAILKEIQEDMDFYQEQINEQN